MLETPEQRSVTATIYGYVNGRATELGKSYIAGNGAAKATMAALRAGAGKPPGASLEVWAETLAGLPESLKGRGDALSRAEKAVYTALTLFAVHQQSKSTPMHRPHEKGQPGVSFGAAVSKLAHRITDGSSDSPVIRRYTAIATGRDFAEISYHARGLIRQLRSEDIALDYGQFAADLFLLQSPAYDQSVKRRWARDYFRIDHDDQSEK